MNNNRSYRLLVFFVALLFTTASLLASCNPQEEDKDNSSIADSVVYCNGDIAGLWIITDWDENEDDGSYDPGDKWTFSENGTFEGCGIVTDGNSTGKWSLDGNTLHIDLDDETLTTDNGTWTAGGFVIANIDHLTAREMWLSGQMNLNAINDEGNTLPMVNNIKIKLAR